MKSNAITPLFDTGYDMGAYLVASGILSKAWEASEGAYHSDRKQFIVQPTKDENLVFIAFPGTSNSEDVITNSEFGVCAIINNENEYFRSLKRITTGEPGLVHSGFLNRFLDILHTSNITEKVREAQEEKKTIVFTGHSLGGALATLAALWVLEKRQDSPLCVTFGCPLVGDENLAHAIRRERWVGHFCHVVSRHDIVPRILLAPIKSVSEPLKALLPYWWDSMKKKKGHSMDDNRVELPGVDTCKLLATVKKHAAAVANTVRATSIVATNLAVESIKHVVARQSPYRPFGYFVFCSSSGAACIEDYATVLQMLYHTLQNPDKSVDHTNHACITEHTDYRATVRQIDEELLNPGGIAKLAISDANSAYEVGIAVQLQYLGLGVADVRAWLDLQAGVEAVKRRNINSARKAGELGDAQAAMAKIEWYKKCCADDRLSYYDSFKQFKDKRDLEANLARLKLAAFWDEVIEMVDKRELPDDFESQNKWVNAGTAYRRLVEPLDIANYYRLGKDEDADGHYLYKGRPRRYKVLERWLQQKEEIRSHREQKQKSRSRPASLTTDSLFWGYLEELLEIEEKQPSPEDATSKRLKFQGLVGKLVENNELSGDAWWENSSFVNWWKKTQNPLKIEPAPLLVVGVTT